MPRVFDPEAFAAAWAEHSSPTKALESLNIYPPVDSPDPSGWVQRTCYRYRQREDVQKALVEIYSKKAAMEYADCLPLASSRVKDFLSEDFKGNAKAMKAQADLGAKILQDANIALGGSAYKQPLIENRNELLAQLTGLILADSNLVRQIADGATSVVNGEAATVVSPETDECSGSVQSLSETG